MVDKEVITMLSLLHCPKYFVLGKMNTDKKNQACAALLFYQDDISCMSNNATPNKLSKSLLLHMSEYKKLCVVQHRYDR